MQKKRRLKPCIVQYLYKIMITIVVTLIVLILIKSSSIFKANFYKYVFDTSFKFNDVINLYHKYFGSIVDNNKKTEIVSSDKITYNSIIKYKDGAKLSVGTNYSVPNQESGVVVYIGEKDNYGKVIIVQQINGIDMWYGNISDTSLKLYDYVTKGSIIGNCNNHLYIIYKKDGKILPYEEYL